MSAHLETEATPEQASQASSQASTSEHGDLTYNAEAIESASLPTDITTEAEPSTDVEHRAPEPDTQSDSERESDRAAGVLNGSPTPQSSKETRSREASSLSVPTQDNRTKDLTGSPSLLPPRSPAPSR